MLLRAPFQPPSLWLQTDNALQQHQVARQLRHWIRSGIGSAFALKFAWAPKFGSLESELRNQNFWSNTISSAFELSKFANQLFGATLGIARSVIGESHNLTVLSVYKLKWCTYTLTRLELESLVLKAAWNSSPESSVQGNLLFLLSSNYPRTTSTNHMNHSTHEIDANLICDLASLNPIGFRSGLPNHF